MFSMKKVISIIGVSLVLLSSGYFYKSYQNKKEFEKLINSIDLNNLEGKFLLIKDYEINDYVIDEKEFNKEFVIYLDTLNSKLKYQYYINSIDDDYEVVVEYQLGSLKCKKKYVLKMVK